MRTRGPTIAAALLALAVATPVRAERHAEEATTLGYQAERAHLVAVGTPGVVETPDGTGDATGAVVHVRLRVTDVLRDTAETDGRGVTVGDEVLVRHQEFGHGQPWREGLPHLVFLVRVAPEAGGDVETEAAATVYAPLSGPFSWQPVEAETPAARFPGLVRGLLATHAAADGRADPAALAAVLVRMCADKEDPHVAWSGAVDLVRRADARAVLTDADRLAVLSAFRACSAPGRTRRALALAVGHVGHPEAAPTLLDVLAQPDARPDRHAFAEALRLLDDPRGDELAAERLTGADPEQRRNLLNALGVFGGRASLPVLRTALADDEPTVRVEAAHALGLVARTVHREVPGEVIEGRDALLALLETAKTRDELRATVWCLAQLDDPAAFAALRALSDRDPRADVRRFAERYLARPRSSLFLDAR